jgi:hypothetical protein
MVNRKHMTTEEALETAKRLVAQGKMLIANEAASQPGSVHVRAYARHKPKSHPYDERGVLVLQWSRKGVGFGELTLTAKDGKLYADTEHMGDAFVLDILAQALREREEM